MSPNGVEIGQQYIEAVKDLPVAQNSRAVERFLGFVKYHRSYILGFYKIVEPLQALTG